MKLNMNIENLNLEVNDSIFERLEALVKVNAIHNPRSVTHKGLIGKFKKGDIKSQFTVAIISLFKSLDNLKKEKKQPEKFQDVINFSFDIIKKCADQNYYYAAALYANYVESPVSKKVHYLKIAIKSDPEDIDSREQLLKLYYKNMNSGEQNLVSNKEYEQILLDLAKLELKVKDSSKFDYGENPYMMRYLEAFIIINLSDPFFYPYKPDQNITDKKFNQARDLLIEFATVFKNEYACVLANLYFFGLSGYLVANKSEALKWAEISKGHYGPPDIEDQYGDYQYPASLMIAHVYLEKGKKKEAQEIYKQIIMSINTAIIDENNIYENWDENKEINREIIGFQEDCYMEANVFYEAFAGLASTLDFGEEKINCLRNSMIFDNHCKSYLKLLEIALEEFKRKKKILHKEVIDKELRDAILNEWNNSDKHSSILTEIVSLFSQNIDFFNYFLKIGADNTNILDFPKSKIARPINTDIKGKKLTEMEAKVEELFLEQAKLKQQLKTMEEIYNQSEKKNKIKQDESSEFEFKASVWTPYPEFPKKEGNFYFLGKEKFLGEKQVYNFIKNQTLKAIIAFLNSNGGEVVIGIHEKDHKKEYVGIQYDLRNTNKFKSKDSYIQFIYSQINNYILPFSCKDFINVEILKEDHVELCIIKVKRLPKKYQPARLLDNKEEKIYIRNGNATEEIVGNKLIRYFERLRR